MGHSMTDQPKKNRKITTTSHILMKITMVIRVGRSVMEWPTSYLNKIFKNVYLEFVWTIF